MALDILCDFDGTITREDVTDTLLAATAAPAWEAVERDWVEGRIDGRTCMTRQVALIDSTFDEMVRVIDGVSVDAGFRAFATWCGQRGHRLRVVSDGLDRPIRQILTRIGVDVPVLANALEPAGPRTWRLGTPYARSDCRSGAAHCKCAAVDPTRTSILIGDGRSDVCVAGQVDLVLAKVGPNGASTLLRHCRETGVPHRSFERFEEVSAILNGHAIPSFRHRIPLTLEVRP